MNISELLVNSIENGDYTMHIRAIELYTLEEFQAKYEKKLVMGMQGEIPAYIIEGDQYRAWYIEEMLSKEITKCIIEESPNGIKISTIDLKYQIADYMIKSIKQIRFDHFDWYEGYVNIVGVNDLDGNELASLEIEEHFKNQRNSSDD